MPFIPVPDALEVVAQYSIGSIIFQNVFGYAYSSALDQTKTDAIGTVLSAAYGELLGAQKTTVTYDSVVVTELATETGAQFTATTFGSGAGTDTAELLPFQTAALISWGTSTRGRSFRGRTYIGGFCEDQSSGRDIAADLLEALTDFTEHVLGDAGFAVVSRFSGVDPDTGKPIPRAEGLVTPFSFATVHPLWRTQRRRATR